MAIKYKSADEPLTVKPPVTVIYGPPGVGKTTFALTSRNPLLLDFDRRAAQAGMRAPRTVEVETWRDIAQLSTDSVIKNIDTVVIDTVGRALDVLSRQLVTDERRLGKRNGGLTLEGYGVLKATWSNWVRALQATGKGVVMVCHSTEQRDNTGDGLIERLDIVGSSRDYTYQISDVMGRLTLDNEGVRKWITRPSLVAFGKDPTGNAFPGDRTVPPIPENPNVLRDFLDEITDFVINRNTAQKVRKLNDAEKDMRQAADACDSPEALTALAHESKHRPKSELDQIIDSARIRKWVWDTKTQCFVA